MTSFETAVAYDVREDCSFYGIKEKIFKQNAIEVLPKDSFHYTPTVKKLATLSSSDSESDSNIENTPKPTRRRKTSAPVTPKSNRKCNNSQVGLSPPKQSKLEKSEEVLALTPSTLLKRIDLNPIDKKEDKLTPKRLFISEIYQNAQQVLHCSMPNNLTEREEELKEMQDFIQQHYKNKTSGSLFIAGCPGTGKTACLTKIMQQKELKSKVKMVYVNCTGIKSAGTVYNRILQNLDLPSKKSEKINKANIEEYLLSDHKMLLLILDEIDHLDSKNQSILYSLFEWPSKPKLKMILIGISNDLILTDRLMPRLQGKCNLQPKIMYFHPYSKEQIINIITSRLQEGNVNDIFAPAAIKLLAGKVAAISGDVRKALDICQRVVGIARSNKSAQVLQPTHDNGFNTNSPKKQPSALDKQIQSKEVMLILNEVYGAVQNLDKQDDTFPLQQKLLICAFLLILNKGRNKEVTIAKLHEVYGKICRKRTIQILDFSEFLSICSLIEERGILKIVGKKEPRLSKVHLLWDQEQLVAVLQDRILLAEIINDVGCL